MTIKPWTIHQDRALKAAFRQGGWSAACGVKLQGRTASAVKGRVVRLGLAIRSRSDVALAADVITAFTCTPQMACKWLSGHPEARKIGKLWSIPWKALDVEVARRASLLHLPPVGYLTREQAAKVLGIKPDSLRGRVSASTVKIAGQGHWGYAYLERDVFAYRDNRRKAA